DTWNVRWTFQCGGRSSSKLSVSGYDLVISNGPYQRGESFECIEVLGEKLTPESSTLSPILKVSGSTARRFLVYCSVWRRCASAMNALASCRSWWKFLNSTLAAGTLIVSEVGRGRSAIERAPI